MKDERDAIIRLRDGYWAEVKKLNALEASFIRTGCRYRKDGNLCGHSRHTIKKYPQHVPVMPLCGVPVCPRN